MKPDPYQLHLIRMNEKVNTLCAYLNINPDEVHLWSDNSLTVGNDDITEYYITIGKRKYDKLVAHVNNFNIYRKN